jgi:hypothetical protein
MTFPTRGALIEYGLTIPPLALVFDYNPEKVTRTRTVTIKDGVSSAARGGYGFALPTEASRASQGVSVEPESFSLKILLDATEAMRDPDDVKHATATAFGVQPEIDTIRSMLEPKSQAPSGVQTLSALGLGEQRAFSAAESASVLLFVWGFQVLPVFMTQAQIDCTEFLPSLFPYRAEASLTLRVIESANPFYDVEVVRQTVGAALNTVTTVASIAGDLF